MLVAAAEVPDGDLRHQVRMVESLNSYIYSLHSVNVNASYNSHNFIVILNSKYIFITSPILRNIFTAHISTNSSSLKV